ncbi:MAG: hypothetical protein ABI488_27280 [Polyangiaceae bacterium]
MRYLMILCGMLSFGCALDATSAPEEQEPASTTEAVNNWVDGPFTWTQGQSLAAIRPYSTHLCVMTRITGNFGGLGESFSLWHDADFWYTEGTSQQSGLGAEVYCFRRSGLPGGTSNVSKYYSAQSEGYKYKRCFGPVVNSDVWGFDAALALTGMSGKFEGGGERVRTIQATSSANGSSVTAETCNDAPVMANAYAFTFTKNAKVKFEGPGGEVGTATQIREISITGSNGYAVLAPVGQSFCYFTSISGAFHGAGEFAQIRPERIGSLDYWVLRGGSLAGGVNLSARCVARNQN